jgi:hypothetical protein
LAQTRISISSVVFSEISFTLSLSQTFPHEAEEVIYMKNKKNQLVPLTGDSDAEALDTEGYIDVAIENLMKAENNEQIDKIVKDARLEIISLKSSEAGAIAFRLEIVADHTRGRLLKSVEKSRGGQGYHKDPSTGRRLDTSARPTLADMGVENKSKSSRIQWLAQIPPEELREEIHKPNMTREKLYVIARKYEEPRVTIKRKKNPDGDSRLRYTRAELVAGSIQELLDLARSEKPHILIPTGKPGRDLKVSLKEAKKVRALLNSIGKFTEAGTNRTRKVESNRVHSSLN